MSFPSYVIVVKKDDDDGDDKNGRYMLNITRTMSLPRLNVLPGTLNTKSQLSPLFLYTSPPCLLENMWEVVRVVLRGSCD